MTHYDDDVLILYTLEPTYVPDQADLESHLRKCNDCDRRLQAIREMDRSFAAGDTWQSVDERIRPEVHLAQFRELSSRYRSEDEEARQLLAPCLSDPVRFIWENVPPKKRYRTAGCVRLLCMESNKACETNPLHARNLADVAVTIAETLSADAYGEHIVQQLHANAQCELANALRYLGEFRAAHDSLDRARRAFQKSLAPAIDCARIDYIRATILWKQQNWADGLPLIQKTADVFLRHRNLSRYNDAKTIEGGMLFDQHRFSEALVNFKTVYDSIDSQNEPPMAARAAGNIANCYLELGDTGSAGTYFLISLQLWEALGFATETARVRWSIGCMALAAGNLREAIRRLRASKVQFEALHMFHEVALITLDLMDALLASGESEEVRELSTLVVKHVRESSTITGALTAAAFVREAAALGRLTRTTVQIARRYLSGVHENPALIFCPPRIDPPI